MDKQTLIRIGIWAMVILGPLVGILVPAYCTYCSIKNTKGTRERAYMVRSSIVCWVVVGIFVVGTWWVPAPYLYGLWVIYFVALVFAVRHGNKRLAAIRAEESNRDAS